MQHMAFGQGWSFREEDKSIEILYSQLGLGLT